MAEEALLKAARSLDQGGPETVVSKLQRLWDALAATSASTSAAGRFHASEEVALRWLLKNMHSSSSGPVSPETETLRRWPLTWRILACIFGRIPLFSLAKSLADRRFVSVLQQTAKDLATPNAALSSSAQSSLKRKRSQDARFDLASLRELQNCVVSAGALFEALRVLLTRLDDGHDSTAASASSSASILSPYDHMGAEHIKSFFNVPASDANALLEPLLKICRLALTTEEGVDVGGWDSGDDSKPSTSTPIDGQASWISTFSTLWELRLQGPNDAFDVAGRLSLDGLSLLGRLLDVVPSTTTTTTRSAHLLDPALQRRWTAGLLRFFTNNLVLTARSLFVNLKDVNALSIATSNSAAKTDANDYIVRATTFLYLALNAPRLLAGSGTSSKDNELWLQTVFETIREPLMASILSAERKNTALAGLLDMAAQHSMAPSIDSLQQVCQKCALQNDLPKSAPTTDWRLLASIARCDADAFLLADKGASLLNAALEQLSTPSTAPQSAADAQFASAFLISLARGFAGSRNLSGFVTRWQAGIISLCLANGTAPPVQNAWLAKDLRAAVADTVQTALSKEQLLSAIAEVENSSSSGGGKDTATAEAVARLVIFDALSAGIRSEEFEDAVHTKMLDTILSLELSSSSSTLPPEILAIQWRLVRRTLAWVGFSDAERIWTAVKASLKSLAASSSKNKSASVLTEDKFEALVCSFSLWMAVKFGDKSEQAAREMTWAFFTPFKEELSALVKDSQSRVELLQEVGRQTTAVNGVAESFGGSFDTKTAAVATYLTEMVKSSDESSAFLDALLAWQTGLPVQNDTTLAANALSTLVYNNVTNLQNQKVTSNITEAQVKRLEEAAGKRSPGLKETTLTLLQTPSHLLSRSQRERIVATLLPLRPPSRKPAVSWTVEEIVLALDLLTKVTHERAFGEIIFDRLVYFGETVAATVENVDVASALGVYDRFRQVARAVIKSPACKDDCAISKAIPTNLQLVLYGAKLVALKDVVADGSAQLQKTKEQLASIVVKQLLNQLESKDEDVAMTGTVDATNQASHLPLQLLLTFDAAMAGDIQAELVELKKFSSLIKKATKTADALCANHQKIGWKWKAFIARYTRGQESRPARDVRFQGLFLGGDNGEAASVAANTTAAVTAASVLLDGDLIRDYLAGETADYDQASLLSYTAELIDALDTKEDRETSSFSSSSSSTIGQLLAIQYLLVRLFETPGAATAKTPDGFYFGVVHSKLAQRLPRASSVTECKLVAQTIRTLLMDDKAAGAMGQWNVDATLGAAASVVGLKRAGIALGNNDMVRASIVAFDGACQLVEAVLKRHRVRLEGRFHLLVGTLQALLARLAAGHQDELKHKSGHSTSTSTSTSSSWNSAKNSVAVSWAAQAKRFSRLLELICEPSTAAVTMMTSRKGSTGIPAAPLHSATDAAKRSAGQHMYLVLMTYIKLQIDGAVLSRSVREALEPGLFSVLAITPDGTRRLLNDAVDASGRALFKDLYRRWLQFGKWKGV
ncbi:hypothetical protein SPBR_00041 [Sporothrix brasiliensis 5110]|uniref:Nucleolar 27S pre-rRNA processing Urb2/Npa2 C-terminal domain-containing protein n=1 Tax=Sporothrix brasiliensis 5110 TaxID=1398154 RepID=A0A0C2IU84_9PEZI|nr:uncharacterized protein SPBR_00041 [Sporothrix brasiliensis 5110]KIH90330.1 hypothetical protein SPBR_00041 [Sporothrix brasiliensis 5110]